MNEKEAGEYCEECDNFIPDEDGGSLVNEHHKQSCSLHPDNCEE